MTNGYVALKDGWPPGADVDDGVVLDVGSSPDGDRVIQVVPPDHCPKPYTGLVADLHVPDDDRVGGDPCRWGNAGSMPFKGKD